MHAKIFNQMVDKVVAGFILNYMVENKGPALDSVFHALSDGTRRAILERVLTRPATVGQLAEPFQMSLAAVAKHVVVLESAQLVNRTRQGRQTLVTARPDELKPAVDLLQYYATFWKQNLDSLEEFLLANEREKKQEMKNSRARAKSKKKGEKDNERQ